MRLSYSGIVPHPFKDDDFKYYHKFNLNIGDLLQDQLIIREMVFYFDHITLKLKYMGVKDG